MFGIDDLYIWLPYAMGIACVIFSAWYGIRNWNKEDSDKGKGEIR